ncbi:hybrid sensor histidine kinase/response regulator [Sphingomonas sp.]|uniref:hybrid sensor histidine kinase/response regulator n=1 Tax=Sphingomonas sp. TaxID=28214 RepID=UPI001B2A8403|nr:hybrid sensor histidine kinase/response regulator [Sphingomonas sp.]MBO9711451.1 PAS domain-containing protein [Sphingomonas sp.]
MATDAPARRGDLADQRLGAILAAAGASGTWDWDLETERLHVDQRFADLYGIDPAAQDDLRGSTFFAAIHPDDKARIRIAVAGIRNGAELFSKEFRILTPDGVVHWMHGRGESQRDADERPIRFTGILIDVTERKRTEERLRIAQSAGGVGTFEYSDGFATATVSEEFCRLLGLHPTSVLPVRTINGVVRANHGTLLPDAEQRGNAPDTLDGEFCIVRASDGAERWIARRGEIVREGGSGYRMIGVIYDITGAKAQEAELRTLNETLESRVESAIAERHEAEEALRQAQKMEAVGQLTGGIAHDFNNLLTVIIGNVDTVLRRLDASADPRARRSLDNALKGAERAASLTQRLLAFSRQQPLDPKPIDVPRLLAGMSDLLTRSITEAVAIHIDAADETWPIEADPHQLENAILNLAVNARDAMPGGGSLTISARNERLVAPPQGSDGEFVPGDHVAIAVADTGWGMPAEIVAKVFDPFFTTKEVGKGTGLGLSMVYGFVKQSGGHVGIDSRPGEGTIVTLYLPRLLHVAEVADEEGGESVERGSGSESVLVVEDDDDVRAYTVGALRELGYRVIEAHDGASALRLLERQEQPVQLLLTDVVMPEMPGSELADAAREIQPGLRVLYTSGYTRDAIMRDGRLEPGVDLLAKPFTFATLAGKVRDLLGR